MKNYKMFSYNDKNLCFHFFDCDGQNRSTIIPPKMVSDQDEKAILIYANEHVKEHNAKAEEKKKKQALWGKNPDYPIKTEYYKIHLTGKIVSVSDQKMLIKLESPVVGEDYYNFDAADAILGGCYIWEEDGQFSRHAIKAAEKTLIDIYKTHKNKPVKDLVDRLNKGIKNDLHSLLGKN